MINVDRAFIIESMSCLLLITLGKDVVAGNCGKIDGFGGFGKNPPNQVYTKIYFFPRPPIFSFFYPPKHYLYYSCNHHQQPSWKHFNSRICMILYNEKSS